MSKQHQECDDSRLAILLEGDEESAEFQLSADHLETCEQCRQRLTALAADGETWDDVSSLLRDYEVGGPFEGGLATSESAPPLDLRFLATPSHPEMLGRLGRYEIEKVIGSGGMGVVLKGHDSELNRPVAIKVLASHLAHSGAARQRFAREGRAAAAVVHEHVVSIHNVESEAQLPFLVMQYVPGWSLQTRVDRQGPLSTKEILRIGSQAAAGLAAAHAQGVVHRDIKPSNILLENDVERALLTDFGLARAADDATVTRTGVIAGTPHYMSPEQAAGLAVDERSDLFSLGSLLYFMATGHPPFRAERALAVLNRICNDSHRPAWQVNAEIPDELSDIIDRLLEKKPGRRFASAEQVREALVKLLEQMQQPGGWRRRSALGRWVRSKRRALMTGISATVAVALLGLAVNGFFTAGKLADTNSPVEKTSTQNEPPDRADLRPDELTVAEFRRAVARLQGIYAEPSQAFVAELAEVDKALQQMEQSSAGRAYLSLATAEANWQQELQQLNQKILEIEDALRIDPQIQETEQ